MFFLRKEIFMSKESFSNLVKGTKTWTTKHAPEILTSIGITGMISATIFAIKATPKAVKLMEEKKKEERKEKLTAVETVKATWKCYIPAATTCVFSTACLIGANSVNVRRNAALATAYKISETALKEYKDKAVEIVGEKKEKEIREAIAKDKVKEKSSSDTNVIITGSGSVRCFDTISGRDFWCDPITIKNAEIEINRKMLRDDYVSLTDFYNEVGLDPTSVSDDLGWTNDGEKIEIDFSSQLLKDNTPCLVLDYSISPKYNYWRFG